MEYVTLNNGVTMPYIGCGTWPLTGNFLQNLVVETYALGYESYDTAWLYRNERDIGDALKKMRIPREKLFLTSKLHINNLYLGGYHRIFRVPCKTIKSAFEDSCKKLGTEYLDLYLIHWPFPNYQYMWDELVKLYREGRVRAIGVSSFLESHIEELKRISDVVPAVNQFEVSPLNTRKELIKYCQSNGIQVEAYSPFGRGVGTVELMNNPLLRNIANNHCKSIAQIILRWFVQQGVITIPRSNKIYKLKENIAVFDFVLSEQEMKIIDLLNKDLYFGFNPRMV